MSIQFNAELLIFNIGKHYNETELYLVLLIKNEIFSSKRLNMPLSINDFQKSCLGAMKYINKLQPKK